jgi:hypothetical protein
MTWARGHVRRVDQRSGPWREGGGPRNADSARGREYSLGCHWRREALRPDWIQEGRKLCSRSRASGSVWRLSRVVGRGRNIEMHMAGSAKPRFLAIIGPPKLEARALVRGELWTCRHVPGHSISVRPDIDRAATQRRRRLFAQQSASFYCQHVACDYDNLCGE